MTTSREVQVAYEVDSIDGARSMISMALLVGGLAMCSGAVLKVNRYRSKATEKVPSKYPAVVKFDEHKAR